MGFRLAPSNLTLDDLRESKTKVTVLDVKYVVKERQELRCWIQWRLRRVPIGFTLDDLERLKVKGHNALIQF